MNFLADFLTNGYQENAADHGFLIELCNTVLGAITGIEPKS
jgi:hypothetical protein